jgi:hypothetical protein
MFSANQSERGEDFRDHKSFIRASFSSTNNHYGDSNTHTAAIGLLEVNITA